MDRCPICRSNGATIAQAQNPSAPPGALEAKVTVTCPFCEVPFELSSSELADYSCLVEQVPRAATGLRRRWYRQLLEGRKAGARPVCLT